MSAPIIRVDDLTRCFGDVTAVDRVTFTVLRGSVFGFLGPNGAGKSTTIRLLLGLIVPSSGSLEVCGYDPVTRGADVRRSSGALLEHSGVYERLSGKENLEFYGRLLGIRESERRARIEALLRRFGLWERRNDPAGTWSRGMKQKLAIARALLHSPPLIFLDEPTAGLDPAAAASLREDIAAMSRDEGVTVFLTTHNLSEVERLCDAVGILQFGKLVAAGTPETLRRRTTGNVFEIVGSGITQQVATTVALDPRVTAASVDRDRLTVTIPSATSVATLLQILEGTGVTATSVRERGGSFEDTYLALTAAETEYGS